jgi:predicted dehydrogenase
MTLEAAAPGDIQSGPIRLGIIGLGKIARDQHIPALLADPRFRVVAVATTSRDSPLQVPAFADLQAMLESTPDLQAVSFCTPPQGRYALARAALDHGLHVMLEKPPGVTPGEVEDLIARAHVGGVALYASWHSRAAAAVGAAQAWLARRRIRTVSVEWLEDVRKWHPGQKWIWQPGGLGVFDPGINALSIVTRLLPRPLFVTAAELFFPSNRDTPIAANLSLGDSSGLPITAQFDFRRSGDERWTISVDTDSGRLELHRGGASLEIDGREVTVANTGEYPQLYRHFADLVLSRTVDADLSPLRLVADAFLIGRRVTVEPFDE